MHTLFLRLTITCLLYSLAEAAGPSKAICIPITTATGDTQPRLEIRQLQQNADQFNIYLLALKSMQSVSISNLTSYYQISGIHGAPYTVWDGVPRCNGCASTGYCTHGSTQFLAWHRPYLALFEQTLQKHALAAAHDFTDPTLRVKYTDAATALRAPYWDWAADPSAGDNVFPNVAAAPVVSVVVANGSTLSMANPLYAYDLTATGFAAVPKYVDSQVTYRGSDAVANSNSQQPQMQSVLFQLLSSVSAFNDFGSFMVSDEQVEDIESLHGEPHNYIGGYMPVVPLAAFDPIFWLHHAMIDRCFALWQALYPNSWMSNVSQRSGTFTFTANTVQGPNSPLTPFHSGASGTFWTANRARNTTALGYVYSDAASRQVATSAINRLYSKSSLAGPSSRKRQTAAGSVQGLTTQSGAIKQYSIRITAQYGILDGSSFTVYFFTGPYDAGDQKSWINSPSYLGSKGFLQDPTMSTAALQSGTTVTGTIPLTLKLVGKVQMGQLESASQTEVQDWISRNLQVVVVKADKSIVPKGDVKGLDAALTVIEVTPAASDDALPSYGKVKTVATLSI